MTSRLRPGSLLLLLLLLPFAFLFSAEPIFAQPASPEAASSEGEKFQAKINAAAHALGDNPRFKRLSPEYRQELVEFVVGNMLFVMLHEIGHAAITEMGLPVLGRPEDAADSFAAVGLIRIGSVFSQRVLSERRRLVSRRPRDMSVGTRLPL
jgi:hypothetical protein